MALLPNPQNPTWPDVFQIETNTPWVGGEHGTCNIQAKAFLERTEYLKKRSDEIDEAKQGQSSLLERMQAIGSSPKALFKKEFVPLAPVAATTEEIDLVTGGLLIIDGIQTVAGDLVFVKDQTNAVENGFWEAQTGAWNRYAGYGNGSTSCFTQMLIDIHAGDDNHGLIFLIDTDAYVVGETPLIFVESYLSVKPKPGTALFRNRDGEVDDVNKMFHLINHQAAAFEGRHLADVLHGNRFRDVMDKLHERNMDTTSKHRWDDLMVFDYLDGMDLSAIPAEKGGDAGQAWNDTYKNNRIVLSGFNTYLGFGDTEITRDHLLFNFRHCPIRKKMNDTDDNTGGYTATDMRAFLEGLNGDGTGDKAGVTTAAFRNALIDQIGPDRLLTIRKAHSTKGSQAWKSYSVFLPSELEVTGYPTYGDEGVYMVAITSPAIAARAGWNTNVQFPIYAMCGAHRIKRYNGARQWWFLQTPAAYSSATFAIINGNGNTGSSNASSVGGCAPAFCVA